MIVLGLPAVGVPGNIMGDSGFLEIYRPLVAMSERFGVAGQVHVPWDVPFDVCMGLSTPRVRVVRNGRGVWNQWFPDLYRFSVLFCQDPIDLIFTQQKGLPHMMQAMINDRRPTLLDWQHIPIVLHVLKVALAGHSHDPVTKMSEREDAVAALFAHSLVGTAHERDLMIALARKVLSPASVNKVMEQTHVMPNGIGDDVLAMTPRTTPREGIVTVAYAGRMNSNKMHMKALEIADLAFKLGAPLKVVVISNSQQAKTFAKVTAEHPYIEVYHNVQKDQFLRRLEDIDIVVNASVDEGYTVTVAELLTAGKIVVLPNRPWAHALAGADYPFQYDTPLEAVNHVRWLAANLGHERVRRLRAAMRARFADDGEAAVAARIYRIFADVLAGVDALMVRSPYAAQRDEALDVMADLGSAFTFDEFIKAYLAQRRPGNKGMKSKRGTAGTWYVYKWICQAGYEMVDYHPSMAFRKRED